MKLQSINPEYRYIPRVPSYIFIESIVNSGVLSEAEKSMLATLLQAGLARLKAAMTPRSSADLNVLLHFMAPDGGGSRAVNELLDSAKRVRGSLLQQDDWWDNLFGTLNIDDEHIQRDIKSQVAEEFGSVQPQTKPQPNRPKSPELEMELNKGEQYKDELKGIINKSRTGRDVARSKISDLQSRLDALMRQTQSESIFKPIAELLSEFKSVRYQLNEQGESDIFRKLGTYLANPKYAERKMQSVTSREDNQRAAKLALQISIDHLRDKFAATLEDAGLTPSDIIKTYQRRQSLIAGGLQTPEETAEYNRLGKQIGKVFELFNPKWGEEAPPTSQPNAPGPGTPGSSEPSRPDDAGGGLISARKRLEQSDPLDPDQPLARSDALKTTAREMLRTAASAINRGENPMDSVRTFLQQLFETDPAMAQLLWKLWQRYVRNKRRKLP